MVSQNYGSKSLDKRRLTKKSQAIFVKRKMRVKKCL